MGFRGRVSRSNLAHANEQRDWRIYADFAQGLIAQARRLYHDEPLGVQLQETVYAFDSTTIDLCLSLFPWAQFRRHKSAVKIHTLLDLRGSIPTSVYVTGGQVHDVNLLDQLVPEQVRFICSSRLRGLSASLRPHPSLRILCHPRRAEHALPSPLLALGDGSTGLRSDQTIRLTGPKSSRRYPAPLRRIHYFDTEKNMRLIFLSNNFQLPALTIADLYRARWQVELFFRWIKQHLHIRAFYGTLENAVKTQVWIAITVYVLVAILKKQLQLDLSLYKILQILSVTIFEKNPILQGFSNFDDGVSEPDSGIQLKLLHV